MSDAIVESPSLQTPPHGKDFMMIIEQSEADEESARAMAEEEEVMGGACASLRAVRIYNSGGTTVANTLSGQKDDLQTRDDLQKQLDLLPSEPHLEEKQVLDDGSMTADEILEQSFFMRFYDEEYLKLHEILDDLEALRRIDFKESISRSMFLFTKRKLTEALRVMEDYEKTMP